MVILTLALLEGSLYLILKLNPFFSRLNSLSQADLLTLSMPREVAKASGLAIMLDTMPIMSSSLITPPEREKMGMI